MPIPITEHMVALSTLDFSELRNEELYRDGIKTYLKFIIML